MSPPAAACKIAFTGPVGQSVLLTVSVFSSVVSVVTSVDSVSDALSPVVSPHPVNTINSPNIILNVNNFFFHFFLLLIILLN